MKFHGTILLLFLQFAAFSCQNLSKIKYLVSKPGVTEFYWTNNATLLEKCPPSLNLTIIVHGYTESKLTSWRKPLTTEFLTARGGCVIFMEYSGASLNYNLLVSNFSAMTGALAVKLLELENLGYDLTEAHMFGFSYGGMLVLEAAYQYNLASPSETTFGRVDSCDPAGPSFTINSSSVVHASMAAKNVQVIHTSQVLGTRLRFGQKSVNMGRCGKTQVTAGDPHYLCPTIYTNSFKNVFKLVSKAVIQEKYKQECDDTIPEGDFTLNEYVAQMGFHMDFSIPDGSYFADTFKKKPFNV